MTDRNVIDARQWADGTTRSDEVKRVVEALPVGGSVVLIDDQDPVRFRVLLRGSGLDPFLWTRSEPAPGTWVARVERVTDSRVDEEDAEDEGCCGICGGP